MSSWYKYSHTIPFYLGDNHTAAGPWGDYNCDVPNRTVVHLFQTLQRMKDDFDWVYWTGDLTAHNVWQQTREGTVGTGHAHKGGRGNGRYRMCY